MVEKPLVSVIIPAYNAEKWINETIESVLSQDYESLEVIVVDDGSTDGTGLIVGRFEQRVRYIHKLNGGQGSARNAGIKKSKGKYIAFVDSDDLWASNKISSQMTFLANTNLQWAYCDAIAFDDVTRKHLFKFSDKSKQFEGNILEPLFLSCFIQSPTPIVHRNIFDIVGYFDESRELKNREDWDMWLRIAIKYPVGKIASPLTYYRVHKSSVTGGEDPIRRLNGHLAVIEKIVGLESKLSNLKKNRIAICYIDAGLMLALEGRVALASKIFKSAILTNPKNLKAYPYLLMCLLGRRVVLALISLKSLVSRFYRLLVKGGSS